MSHLDEIIRGATDDSVKTSNLLRQVQIASHYLGAEDIKSWAQLEQFGYGQDDQLPSYRAGRPTPVMGTWVSLAFKVTDRLESGALPDEAAWAFEVDLYQSVAELEQLASGEADAEIAWPGHLIVAYNQAAERGLVARMAGANVVMAHRTLTRGMLLGVVDSIRNTALDFALSLQAVDRDAGTIDGPTVESVPIREAIVHITNHIYGDGVNFAQGSGNTQSATVTNGDVTELVRALSELLSQPGLMQVLNVATSGDSVSKKRGKLEAIAAGIRDGSIAVAAGVTADVAADRLLAVASQFLGW